MAEWMNEMNEMLSVFDQQATISLRNMSTLPNDAAPSFTSEFGEFFVNASKNRVSEAYNRFKAMHSIEMAKSAQNVQGEVETGESINSCGSTKPKHDRVIGEPIVSLINIDEEDDGNNIEESKSGITENDDGASSVQNNVWCKSEDDSIDVVPMVIVNVSKLFGPYIGKNLSNEGVKDGGGEKEEMIGDDNKRDGDTFHHRINVRCGSTKVVNDSDNVIEIVDSDDENGMDVSASSIKSPEKMPQSRPRMKIVGKRKTRVSTIRENAKHTASFEMDFVVGEIVWCKLKGYPYWPCKITALEEEKAVVQWYNDYRYTSVSQSQLVKFSRDASIFSKQSNSPALQSAIHDALIEFTYSDSD